ncbi:hypothetical protein NDU88_002238 [Pleurodeles waltl]|uniref:Uncharacterized protein n=1 Tax=Pleurodeles waltl TaxID=8319 RepID=A0AAV7SB17_PLEWA|nr:hypothetical protein NDU88_002238 [Pleurodeles waltl]
MVDLHLTLCAYEEVKRMHSTPEEPADDNPEQEVVDLEKEGGLGTDPELQLSDEVEHSLSTGEEPLARAGITVSALSPSPEELADRKAERKVSLQVAILQLEEAK